MIIKIKNLRLTTIIGIYEWEKTFDREIIINLKITTDFNQSLISDNIESTIDYEEIVKQIKQIVASSKAELVEKLAEEIISAIMTDNRVKKCRLEVDKLKPLADVESFSITLTRKRPKNDSVN